MKFDGSYRPYLEIIYTPINFCKLIEAVPWPAGDQQASGLSGTRYRFTVTLDSTPRICK